MFASGIILLIIVVIAKIKYEDYRAQRNIKIAVEEALEKERAKREEENNNCSK